MTDQTDKLLKLNGELCAEINRQERVIEQLREKEAAYMDANHEQGMQLIEQGKRIRELESLVRDMKLLDCIVTSTSYGRPCESLCPMFHECRSNVCKRVRCLLREDIEKRMNAMGIEV